MIDAPKILAIATLLGAVGMWLLLPRASRRGRWAGGVLGAAGLGMLASQLPWLGEWVANGIFAVLAGVTVVAAVATVTLRNPIYAAIWFGLVLVGTAGLLLFQGAQFLAVATLIVYAGAILVVFLFVLMLAQPKGRAVYDRLSTEALVSAAVGVLLVGVLSMAASRALAAGGLAEPATAQARAREILAPDQMVHIGEELYGRHLIAVEVAGALLLVALIGAAVIVGHARSPLPGEDFTTEDTEVHRGKEGARWHGKS